jgi:hypothetical protein
LWTEKPLRLHDDSSSIRAWTCGWNLAPSPKVWTTDTEKTVERRLPGIPRSADPASDLHAQPEAGGRDAARKGRWASAARPPDDGSSVGASPAAGGPSAGGRGLHTTLVQLHDLPFDGPLFRALAATDEAFENLAAGRVPNPLTRRRLVKELLERDLTAEERCADPDEASPYVVRSCGWPSSPSWSGAEPPSLAGPRRELIRSPHSP